MPYLVDRSIEKYVMPDSTNNFLIYEILNRYNDVERSHLLKLAKGIKK
jgi:hypothetical protein